MFLFRERDWGSKGDVHVALKERLRLLFIFEVFKEIGVRNCGSEGRD